MAAAADAGHRVVLIVATGGEEGEVAEGFLRDGETLRRYANAKRVRRPPSLGRLGFTSSGTAIPE